jgi:RND family efflux transporter MFP subunit
MDMRKNGRIAVIAALGLGATAFAARNVGQAVPDTASKTAGPPEVRTVNPRREQSSAPVKLPVNAEPSEQARLYARISGFVSERRVELGDKVEAGQILAVIENPEQASNCERAKSTLAQNEAQLVLAKANMVRAERLIDQSFVSRSTLETRQAELRVAETNRDSAASEVRRLEELLSFREIRAPFSGVIVERNVERGDLAAGDQPQGGAYLFRVARIESLRIVLNAPQSAVRLVEVGRSARVTFPEFPGEIFNGQISRTSNFINGSSGTMRVEIALANPGGRIPANMFGEVELAGFSQTALRLPTNVVTMKQGLPHVAVVDGGHIRFAPVRLGRDFGAEMEVLEGVTEQQGVVVNPNALLREGEVVAVAVAAKKKPSS